MQCNCGGMTKDHTVTKNKQTIGVYDKCNACGRIHWLKSQAVTDSLRPQHAKRVGYALPSNRN